MKLAKKNNLPVLSFEIFGTTQMGRRVKVAHDVRIEVMKPADVAILTEPRCPEPDVRCNTVYIAIERGKVALISASIMYTVGPDHASPPRQDARCRRTHA
jgi:hypothetical protein